MPEFKSKTFSRPDLISRLTTCKIGSCSFIFLVLFFFILATPAFAAAPVAGSIIPSSGSVSPNISQVFTSTYSDGDGWTNLEEAYFLISTDSSQLSNAVYLYYNFDPAP